MTKHFSISQTIGTLLCNWPILVISFICSGLHSSLFSHMEHMHCSSPSNKHLYTSKDIVKIKWSQPGPLGTLVLQFVPLWCQQNSQPSSRETDSEWEKAGRQAQTKGDGGIEEREKKQKERNTAPSLEHNRERRNGVIGTTKNLKIIENRRKRGRSR